MGQSGAKLRTSTDWTQEKNQSPPPVGSDVTYREGDLLKYTDKGIDYTCNPGQSTRLDLEGVPGAFLVHNLLTPEECQQYIALSEEMGYSQAPLRNLDTINATTFNLNDDSKLIRNSKRVLFDSPLSLSQVLNSRLLPHLNEIVQCEGKTWKVCTEEPINRRWRFNKYVKGNFFKPHFDAGFVYSETKKTIFTFIVYLNEGCEGGETVFYPGNKKFSWTAAEEGIERIVKPKTGSALIFFQSGDLNPRHEGREVLSDDICKYILRSDLAYEVVPDGASK